MLGQDEILLAILLFGWTTIMASIVFAYLKDLKENYIEIEATVTDMESHMSKSKGKTQELFRPRFTYEWKGWQRTVEPIAFASFWKYKIGDKVTIYINPNTPGEFKNKNSTLKMFFGVWIVVVIIIVMNYV